MRSSVLPSYAREVFAPIRGHKVAAVASVEDTMVAYERAKAAASYAQRTAANTQRLVEISREALRRAGRL